MTTNGRWKWITSFIVSLLAIILTGTIWGITQIQNKVDEKELVAMEIRCEKSDNQIREELRRSIESLSLKQDDMYKLLWEMSQSNKREK